MCWSVICSQDIPGESFDIVMMLDVLEHMADPFAELKKSYDILKPDGLLVVNRLMATACSREY